MDFFKRTFGISQEQTPEQKTEPAASAEPEVDHNTPQQSSQGIGSVLRSLLSGKLGSDVMSAVSLPAWLYEPLTILQRSCETLAHSHLLDKAGQCQDPIDRLVWVAAFGISGYCGSERFCTYLILIYHSVLFIGRLEVQLFERVLIINSVAFRYQLQPTARRDI